MNHPSYRAYQSHTAALSLFPNLYVKFLPPDWNAPTPPTPPAVAPVDGDKDSKEKKEWKRRIKMYRKSEMPQVRNVFDIPFAVGPVLEAFGFQRIIFGSSPS